MKHCAWLRIDIVTHQMMLSSDALQRSAAAPALGWPWRGRAPSGVGTPGRETGLEFVNGQQRLPYLSVVLYTHRDRQRPKFLHSFYNISALHFHIL